MWNGRAKGNESGMEAMLGELQEQLRQVTDVAQRRTELTASAVTRDKRVTVTVDADGHLTDLQFSADIKQLSYNEIAAAVVAAAQQAVAEVTRRGGELFEPLNESRARMPKLSELIEGLPDIEDDAASRPSVAGAQPNTETVEEIWDSTLPESSNASPVAAHLDDEALDLRIADAVDLPESSDTSVVVAYPDVEASEPRFEDAVDQEHMAGDTEGSEVSDRGWG
ncbi:YbaB/EbfC family nucleoid-associated protein [Nocardia sp. NBC_00881]|uniref:YbaB/EbfC family nucleoid-associated protein n=1 Tax=Nocardia sp. NBC_00881 TaxID=2975995 RepID=UPI003868D24C|nr:YbaB/EbfC family nucleoid-associated protein [Nocardia sp. NBC_00881]